MARKGHTYPALQLAVIIRRRKEVPGTWAEPLAVGETNPPLSVISNGTNQPVFDGHEPCLQRLHKMRTVFHKLPTLRTPIGSRIVMQGACKLSVGSPLTA